MQFLILKPNINPITKADDANYTDKTGARVLVKSWDDSVNTHGNPRIIVAVDLASFVTAQGLTPIG